VTIFDNVFSQDLQKANSMWLEVNEHVIFFLNFMYFWENDFLNTDFQDL